MSTDLEAIAAKLYPSMQPAQQPASGDTLLAGDQSAKPAEQKPTGEQQPAQAPEVKPGELPDAIKALRDQPARKIFDASKAYTDALRRSEFADTDPALDKAVNAEVSEIFQDLGIGSTEAATLVSLAREHGAASDETVAGWESESNQYLQTLGREARESLQLARTLVARDPRVGAMLDHTGLGSNPEVVRILIEKAKSARLRGEI